VIKTEKRQYTDSRGVPTFQPATEVGIMEGIREDVYVVLAGVIGEDTAEMRITFNPLVWWVWYGGLIMAIGGLIVMWPQAERRRAQAGYSTVLQLGGAAHVTNATMSRRRFFAASAAGAATLMIAGIARAQQDGSQVNTGAANAPMESDRYKPVKLPAKGAPVMSQAKRDELEHHIHCQCGCNLDVYTCRTTDFSCEVSPAMHKDVMALVAGGYSAPGDHRGVYEGVRLIAC